MNPLNILIAGCGDVGTASALLLAKDYSIYGLKRTQSRLPKPITTIVADLNDPSTLVNLPHVDIVIYCAAPNLSTNQRKQLNTQQKLNLYEKTYLDGFKNLIASLKKSPKHIFFTSSTSVYHQSDHEVINEQSIVLPMTETGKILLAAEQQVLSSDISATVIRFSGIYSNTRTTMFNNIANGKVFSSDILQYTNRIHVEDCAGIIHHLVLKAIQGKKLQPIYLASDQKPEFASTVSKWIAQQINIIPTEVLKSRSSGSKRCDNTLIINSGYQFIYPSYQEGYKDTIEQFNLQNRR